MITLDGKNIQDTLDVLHLHGTSNKRENYSYI